MAAPEKGADAKAGEEDGGQFECNVCLETASSPVITSCGHLFCWPCLFRWLDTGHNECPVCKAGVTRDNVIPLYGRGSDRKDPRTSEHESSSVPHRPAGHRPAVPQRAGGAGGNQQFTVSAGFGFFPSLFGLQFHSFGNAGGAEGAQLTPEQQQQQALSRILFGVGALVLLALLAF